MKHGAWAAALGLCALLTSARHASAFCRARTCDPLDPKQHCKVDPATNCVQSGQPLHWAGGCLSFAAQKDGSPQWGIGADTVLKVAGDAFSAWLGADCGGGAGPSIAVESLGTVACGESRYNANGKNANIIMFRDDKWPYPGSIDAYALTIVRFGADTGEILDADVEVNSADFKITTDGSGVGADLQSILTHELGHFMGLAHAAPFDGEATMRAFWDGSGLDLRSLTDDDAAGICAAYPAGQPASHSCEPRHGFASACNEPSDDTSGGCGVARPGRTGGALPALLGSALLGALGRLRRRARR